MKEIPAIRRRESSEGLEHLQALKAIRVLLLQANETLATWNPWRHQVNMTNVNKWKNAVAQGLRIIDEVCIGDHSD